MQNTIHEKVRKQETDYISGTTQLSKYNDWSMIDTLDRIDAYHNSKHISGEQDSLGRDKPFFNITIANTNVWYRATDIDRSWIKVRATKSKDFVDSFLATIHIQEWMRREDFGSFLNEWGRVLAKYGSAVPKFVKNDSGLHVSVVPWNRLIVDAVDFDANPQIEIIELTEAQLRGRVKTHGYEKDGIDSLIQARKARETTGKQKKDNKNDYIKLYEVHGEMPLSYITGEDTDDDEFVQQMQVISFVGEKQGRKTEFKDFTLFSGKEEKSPYMITSLIKEDGRTLGKGAIEYLFEPQWMVNHTEKAMKDSLDLASRMIFQTSDDRFVGRNVLSNIETGDILTHAPNEPITLVNNQALNIVSQQNFAVQWQQLGNQITSVSEAMLGAVPKSGTAWRQTEAVLQESHSLFEQMTENKGLYIIEMFREWVIPFIKTKMDTSEEVTATLEQHQIDTIDSLFIKNKAIQLTNDTLKDKILNGENPEVGEQEGLLAENTQKLQGNLQSLGNQRFFKVSELSTKTWKEQFKDLVWELEVDVTGEAKNIQESMTTLGTALQVASNPAFATNKKAQAIVGKILELSGTMSPVEYNAIPSDIQQPQQNPQPLPQIGTPEESAGVL